jgi:hypothetical protein
MGGSSGRTGTAGRGNAGAAGSGNAGSGGSTGSGDPELCEGFTVGVQTDSTPTLGCGLPGDLSLDIQARINTFWGSFITPCACDQPAPCTGNGLVLAQDPGITYYDRSLLERLTSMAGGDLIAPAWLLSHEAGHSIQLKTGMGSLGSKPSELSADCLAGYFLGWLGCIGEASDDSIHIALSTACNAGDPVAQPWFAPGAHGTCIERASAVALGIEGYRNVQRPSLACAYANFVN